MEWVKALKQLHYQLGEGPHPIETITLELQTIARRRGEKPPTGHRVTNRLDRLANTVRDFPAIEWTNYPTHLRITDRRPHTARNARQGATTAFRHTPIPAGVATVLNDRHYPKAEHP